MQTHLQTLRTAAAYVLYAALSQGEWHNELWNSAVESWNPIWRIYKFASCSSNIIEEDAFYLLWVQLYGAVQSSTLWLATSLPRIMRTNCLSPLPPTPGHFLSWSELLYLSHAYTSLLGLPSSATLLLWTNSPHHDEATPRRLRPMSSTCCNFLLRMSTANKLCSAQIAYQSSHRAFFTASSLW